MEGNLTWEWECNRKKHVFNWRYNDQNFPYLMKDKNLVTILKTKDKKKTLRAATENNT